MEFPDVDGFVFQGAQDHPAALRAQVKGQKIPPTHSVSFIYRILLFIKYGQATTLAILTGRIKHLYSRGQSDRGQSYSLRKLPLFFEFPSHFIANLRKE
jgi:hypothetical protein